MQSLLFSTPVTDQDQMLNALIKVLDAFGRTIPIIKQGMASVQRKKGLRKLWN
jgi:hypothetical protein